MSTTLAFDARVAVDLDLAEALGSKLRVVLRELLDVPPSVLSELPVPARVRAKVTKPARTKLKAPSAAESSERYHLLSLAELNEFNRGLLSRAERRPGGWLHRDRDRF